MGERVRTDVLEEVQRDEGRPRRVIISGSREWGLKDPEDKLHSAVLLEQQVVADTVYRLIGRWVQGFSESWDKRQRGLPPGPGLVIVHGKARGADAAVDRVTRVVAEGLNRRSRADFTNLDRRQGRLAEGLWLQAFPADWNRYGLGAGGVRNQEMLDAGADHVIALFAHGRAYGPSIRGGTNDMVRRAVDAGVPVDIYVANDRRWRKT